MDHHGLCLDQGATSKPGAANSTTFGDIIASVELGRRGLCRVCAGWPRLSRKWVVASPLLVVYNFRHISSTLSIGVSSGFLFFLFFLPLISRFRAFLVSLIPLSPTPHSQLPSPPQQLSAPSPRSPTTIPHQRHYFKTTHTHKNARITNHGQPLPYLWHGPRPDC